MGQQAGGDDAAVWQQRGRNFAFFHRDMVVLPLTAAAAVHRLDVLHHRVLGRHIHQLPPRHCLPALVQRPAALRAYPLLIRQLMDHLLHRQAGKVLLPLPRLFPPLIGDLLQIRLRRLGIGHILRLVEQAELLRKHLGLLAGCAKPLPLHEPQLLCEPIHLPVQGRNFRLFFCQQRLPFRGVFPFQSHILIITQKSRDFNYRGPFSP